MTDDLPVRRTPEIEPRQPLDPYTELAYLIMEVDGRPIHALPRHPVLGGGTRLRFAVDGRTTGRIEALCRRQGWRHTKPSGVQMVVDVPVSAQREIVAARARALEQGQRELPPG